MAHPADGAAPTAVKSRNKQREQQLRGSSTHSSSKQCQKVNDDDDDGADDAARSRLTRREKRCPLLRLPTVKHAGVHTHPPRTSFLLYEYTNINTSKYTNIKVLILVADCLHKHIDINILTLMAAFRQNKDSESVNKRRAMLYGNISTGSLPKPPLSLCKHAPLALQKNGSGKKVVPGGVLSSSGKRYCAAYGTAY